MKIILASKSPRRRELMEMLGFRDFLIVPSDDPEIQPEGLAPYDTAGVIARSKAVSVASKFEPDDLVIAADTIVCLDGRIIGKPKDEKEAEEMLKDLSGKTHTVYSGVSVLCRGSEITCVESTEVTFRELSISEIRKYISSGEPMDKAGAYGAQGLGALFVKSINGDFFNVMGLPVFRLGLMLKSFGIDILNI